MSPRTSVLQKQRELRDEETQERLIHIQKRRLGALRDLFTLAYDIEGALGARQYGLAVEQARAALHAALDARLLPIVGARMIQAELRLASGKGEQDDAQRAVDRWIFILDVWNDWRPDLVATLWDLECDAPVGERDCQSYVSRCRKTIQGDLALPIDISKESVKTSLRERSEAARMLSIFSVGPWPTLRVFGSSGQQAATDVDTYDYVSSYVDDVWDTPDPAPSGRDGVETPH
jgi:hypothetical protein